MPADTARPDTSQKADQKQLLTDEELADQAERQSGMLVLRKVAPYLWPANMPWVKRRVIWAMVALFALKTGHGDHAVLLQRGR